MNKKTHIADLTTCFFHTSADNQKKKNYSISVLDILSLSKTFYNSPISLFFFQKLVTMLFLSYKLITSKISIELKKSSNTTITFKQIYIL